METSQLLFTVFVVIFFSFQVNCKPQLIQIQTLTRHGDRSPCFSYPNDPYKHLWTQGLGQLTEKGINQLKEFGTYLRNKYKDLLPTIFHKKDVYIRSSDTDRTIISALAAMSTLFKNQFVPVHTVPKSVDFLLKMSSHCPRHKSLLKKEMKLEKYQNVIAEFKSFFKELEKGTDLQNVDYKLALRICGIITIWKSSNFTFPDWVNFDTVEKCRQLGTMKFTIKVSNPLLTKFRGGPLAEHIVSNMVTKAENHFKDGSGMKMIGFFAHDSTISAFLSHIGTFNQMKLPLATAVIFELYHDGESSISNDSILSQFHIRLLFRNETTSSPHVLNIPICYDGLNSHPYNCRLDILYNGIQQHIFKDLSQACEIDVIDNEFKLKDKDQVRHDSIKVNKNEL